MPESYKTDRGTREDRLITYPLHLAIMPKSLNMSRRLKGLFWGVALCALGGTGAAVAGGGTEISGAGATFPYPIYAKWAEAYHKATGVRFNYQSIGSGGGIKQIKARTVDFGASDAPMKPGELDRSGNPIWTVR